MVEKVATTMLTHVKQLQWGKIFHMYYVEPIVFMLVFAHSLSGN